MCSPTLCIRARTVDEKGKWGILIEFSDFEGGLTRVNLTANTLRRPPALVVKLEEAGLSVGDDAALLSKFIRSHRPSRVIRETPAKSLQGVIIENIKEFVVKNQTRFQGQDNFVPLDRAGFLVDGEICFTKEALRAASGITATRAAKMLLKAGLLHRNDDHLNRKTNTPIGEIRLYCICTSIFEYDPQTLLTPISNPATPVLKTPKPASAMDAPQKPQFCKNSVYLKKMIQLIL